MSSKSRRLELESVLKVGMSARRGAVYLGANDIQLSRGETIGDTAKTLSLYLDCIMARVYNHEDVQTLARYAWVPVINGLSDSFHPCQISSRPYDNTRAQEKLKGLQLAWLGDGDNVCNDLMLGCAKTGISMTPPAQRATNHLKRCGACQGRRQNDRRRYCDNSRSSLWR